MRQPTVLTIILNYRTPEMTLEAVAAAVREMAGIAGEITVVDNDSGDGSFEKLRAGVGAAGWDADGRVRVIQAGRNGGYGAGNNVGIRAGLTRGGPPDYVYILNSDAFPDAGAIRRLIEYLEAHPTVGFAGSYIHGPDGDPHATAFRFPTVWSEFEGAARLGPVSRLLARFVVPLPIPDATGPVDWLAGASVMMRRSVLDAVGLFDERFFLYFEETDLCRRARAAGWPTVYVRESAVTHIGSVSTGMKAWARTPGYWFELAPALLRQEPRRALRGRGDAGPGDRRTGLAPPHAGAAQGSVRPAALPAGPRPACAAHVRPRRRLARTARPRRIEPFPTRKTVTRPRIARPIGDHP